MQNRKKLDTSNELCIYQHGNAVKLIRPEDCTKYDFSPCYRNTGHTIASIFKLPMSIGFVNTSCAVEKINLISANSLGSDSPNKLISKTIFDVADRKTAERVNYNNQNSLRSNNINIYDEDIILKNGEFFSRLTIQLPWKNPNNKVVGLFGFTITLSKHGLAESLAQISELGFLSKNEKISLPITTVENVSLSRRETECLSLLVYGKSAREIGLQLGLKKRTIEFYINNIKNKLNVFTKSELIEKAIHYLFQK